MKIYIKCAKSPLEYNQNQSAVGSTLKTLKGSAIKRSKYGVGKEIGGQIYFQKDYWDMVIPQDEYEEAIDMLEEVYPDFEYNCLRYDPKKRQISFQEAPDFDTAREPIVGDYITVDLINGKVSKGHSNYIWHHKWLWVTNDYTGFNVAESWNWSREWLSVLTEPADGNGASRWVAQLERFGLE